MEFSLATLPPILGLGLLAALVPWVLMRRSRDSLAALARVALASVVILVLAGAVLFALLYGAEGVRVSAMTSDPLAAARHFGVLGLKSALIWGPVLVLTLIGLGQGVERRRGERMARRGRS